MERRWLQIVLLLTTVCCLPVASAQYLSIDEVVEQFEPKITQALDKSGVPGAAVAIVRKNKIIYAKGFGVREVGSGAPVNIHTVFRVASVSKGFASTLAAVLVEEGLLNWNDKIIDYVPDFALKSPYNTENLTIEHVLSHTTGLPSHAYDNLIESNVAYDTVLRRLREVGTQCRVGECYNYQNVIYSVIGDVIEARTGKPFEQVLYERLLYPLQMYDTTLSYNYMLEHGNVAVPHVKSKGKWVRTRITPAYYRVGPAGGVNASIIDMAQWLRAQMGYRPDVISRDVLHEITLPVVKTPDQIHRHRHSSWRRDRLNSAHYGLGWRVYDYAGHEMIYHRGGVRGYRAEIAYLPEEDIGIVILWNGGAKVSDTLVPTFFDIYLDLPRTNWVQLAHK